MDIDFQSRHNAGKLPGVLSCNQTFELSMDKFWDVIGTHPLLEIPRLVRAPSTVLKILKRVNCIYYNQPSALVEDAVADCSDNGTWNVFMNLIGSQ